MVLVFSEYWIRGGEAGAALAEFQLLATAAAASAEAPDKRRRLSIP
jgi:hypothetical protein